MKRRRESGLDERGGGSERGRKREEEVKEGSKGGIQCE